MFETKGLDKLATDLREVAKRELNTKEAANKFADNARSLAPKFANIKRLFDETSAGVQTKDPVTVYWELGTGPVGIKNPYPVPEIETQIGVRHTLSYLAPDAGISRIDRPWHYEGGWTSGIAGKAFMHKGVTEIQHQVIGEMVDELFK